MLSAGGDSGSVDWDGSRHNDHGWGASLNPGAPSWQNRLTEQITSLVERYGFEECFWTSQRLADPVTASMPGWSSLSDASGSITLSCWSPEGWYDGLGRRRR